MYITGYSPVFIYTHPTPPHPSCPRLCGGGGRAVGGWVDGLGKARERGIDSSSRHAMPPPPPPAQCPSEPPAFTHPQTTSPCTHAPPSPHLGPPLAPRGMGGGGAWPRCPPKKCPRAQHSTHTHNLISESFLCACMGRGTEQRAYLAPASGAAWRQWAEKGLDGKGLFPVVCACERGGWAHESQRAGSMASVDTRCLQ